MQREPTVYSETNQEWQDAAADTLGEHQDRQRRVYGLLNRPAATPRRATPQVQADRRQLLRNSVEFIQAGRFAVFVLSPTLSNSMYPPEFWPPLPLGEHSGPDLLPGAIEGNLFFDDRIGYPNQATDQAAAAGDQASPAHYRRSGHETAHADPNDNPPSLRLFMDRDFSDDEVATVVIHEVQHVADRHHGQAASFADPAIQDVNAQVGDVANRYRSEFRAYWLGDLPGGLGDADAAATNTRLVRYGTFFRLVRTLRTHFANQRQERIFWHMVDSGSYPWLVPNYYFSAPFRQLVDGLTAIQGGNLVNSVRIDNVRETLTDVERRLSLVGTAAAAGAPSLAIHRNTLQQLYDELIQRAQTAVGTDRAFLRSDAAEPFWAFFDRAFATDVPTLGNGFRKHKKAVQRRARILLTAR